MSLNKFYFFMYMAVKYYLLYVWQELLFNGRFQRYRIRIKKCFPCNYFISFFWDLLAFIFIIFKVGGQEKGLERGGRHAAQVNMTGFELVTATISDQSL